MCSVYDDESGSAQEVCCSPRVAPASDSNCCMKCRQPVADLLYIRSDEVVCSECFLSRATHKFRVEFGKSRIVRDKERVLVAFSGGSASSAMLHLIQEGVSRRAMKKLRFQPSLLYIDDGWQLEITERSRVAETVVTKMNESGLPFYVCRLEQCMDTAAESCRPVLSNDPEDGSEVGRSPIVDLAASLAKLSLVTDDRLSRLLDSTKTPTAKQSLLAVLRRQLLIRMARCLGFGKVLVGDLATGLAARTISYIAQGRGAELPYEMSFADARNEDVVILRPMREFTVVEIEAYNRLCSIEPVTTSTQEPAVNSIDSLSEKFILYLQSQHENTIAIVCRTAEKLAMADDVSRAATDSERCSLCHSFCDSETCEMFATNSASAGQSPSEFIPTLCYACRRIAQEMTDVSVLPVNSVTCRRSTSATRVNMQQIVDDFLIKDDDVVDTSNNQEDVGKD